MCSLDTAEKRLSELLNRNLQNWKEKRKKYGGGLKICGAITEMQHTCNRNWQPSSPTILHTWASADPCKDWGCSYHRLSFYAIHFTFYTPFPHLSFNLNRFKAQPKASDSHCPSPQWSCPPLNSSDTSHLCHMYKTMIRTSPRMSTWVLRSGRILYPYYSCIEQPVPHGNCSSIQPLSLRANLSYLFSSLRLCDRLCVIFLRRFNVIFFLGKWGQPSPIMPDTQGLWCRS